MGKKRTPGLYKRKGVWHVDKHVHGQRLCESTFASTLEEAEKYLARRIESIRQAIIYGTRPTRTFQQAATKYLLDRQDRTYIAEDVRYLEILNRYLGELPLHSIHMGTLQQYIADRKKQVKNRTINYGLQVLRHLLNLAASEWLDESGLTWLQAAPKIKLLPENDKRKPYPISWEEQERLLNFLPAHLQDMALFAINTGCRHSEICRLRWEWEQAVPSLNTSVFAIPGECTKNGDPKLVVLNDVAKQVISKQRGNHGKFVFTYRGKPIKSMLTSAFKKARNKANLTQVRVHDLRHTFGRRLRSSGVSMEDIADLMGHRTDRITVHYSVAEIGCLHQAVNKICCENKDSPTLLLLRNASSRKSPAREKSDRLGGDVSV